MQRLIPTHAGKTTARQSPPPTSWAHPHSRGENDFGHADDHADRGSSPLTRGKLVLTSDRESKLGLIPTHAGKTSTTPVATSSPEAHPHSRGENTHPRLGVVSGCGSSPLTRGKPRATGLHHGTPRLIPTHAGKTNTCGCGDRRPTAHPHSRGENQGDAYTCVGELGSSPLTRGKLMPVYASTAANGLIPTHAGKTSGAVLWLALSRAHPHSRGENFVAAIDIIIGAGSSPLTRGKHSARIRARRALGLIPTHAGKTMPVMEISCLPWAHPHSRGENAAPFGADGCNEGSSPLTRGKPRAQATLRAGRRLIPTHAGKTRSPRAGGARY